MNTAAAHEHITAHPLLRSILRALVDDKNFVDADTNTEDAVFEMSHGDEEVIYWYAVEESASTHVAHLQLWSNTLESYWVLHADLHVDMKAPSAVTVHLEFVPFPTRATDLLPRTLEHTVATEEDWGVVLADYLEPWMREGMEMEVGAEQEMSDEDTDCDED